MKKLFIIIMTLGAVVIAGGGALLAYAIHRAGAPGPLEQPKIVLIERGSGVGGIASRLEGEGVIQSALIFKMAVALDGDARTLKAGEYEFPARASVREALERMRKGEVYDRKVTIPEGRTSWQVVQMLGALGDLSGDAGPAPEEGSLLPQTYHYVRGETRSGIVARMQKEMADTIAELWPTRTDGLPFTSEAEALTLASIVEKETGVAAERARIAGVFVNRLRRGMPLQSDPTVIYGITRGEIQSGGQGPLGRRLLTKDLEQDTPYNTYARAGLPPGPIANPGRDAIAATLRPESHDYLYFVADGTGGHVFAKSLAEHNANVARWRKIRKETIDR